jgi:hypothetical protein
MSPIVKVLAGQHSPPHTRHVSALGPLTDDTDDGFSSTPLLATLRKDEPGS